MISIIVPCYNVESSLERCVRSILTQSYGDFELILVDDGSTDGTGALCRRFAAEDGRIRIISKENGGVSSARNAGLERARGAQIFFTDADDWLEPTTLEQCMRHATPQDIVWCGVRHDQEDGRLIRASRLREGRVAATALQRIFCTHLESLTAFCWGKLYPRAVVGNIRFDEGCSFGEDMKFHAAVLETHPQSSVYHVATLCYHYSSRKTSLTRNILLRNELDLINAYETLLAKSFFAPVHAELRTALCNTIVQLAYSILKSNAPYEHYLPVEQRLKASFPDILRYARVKCKCFALLYRLCPFSIAKQLSRSTYTLLYLLRGR